MPASSSWHSLAGTETGTAYPKDGRRRSGSGGPRAPTAADGYAFGWKSMHQPFGLISPSTN